MPSSGMATGTYQWDASYSGDPNNLGAGEFDEQTTVSSASPTLTTTASPNVTLSTTAATLSDSATLAGEFDPTGTITFTLTNPSGAAVDTETVAVTGNGTYTTPTGYTLPSSGSVAGAYSWSATYSGDANNDTETASPEQTTVAVPPPTATGTTLDGTEGVPLSGTVATFTDADPNVPLSDFTATIAWGDGTTSNGTVAAQSGGGFAVTGTHTYATQGSYATSVTIDDVGSSAQATGAADIGTPPLSVTHDVLAFEGDTLGPESAGVVDPDGDSVTVTSVTGGTVGAPINGTYGTLTLNADDTFSYTANDLTAINAAPAGATLTDTFTYAVSDGHGGTAAETLDVTVDRSGTQENFGGNGFSGVLWRQSGSEQLAEWAMNGAAVKSGPAPTYQGVPISPDSTWNVVGTGDLSGNGKTDILWQNVSGGIEDWSMNGSQITASNWLTPRARSLSPTRPGTCSAQAILAATASTICSGGKAPRARSRCG